MLKAIQLGHGVVTNDQPIAATNRFYFKGLAQRPFDPERPSGIFEEPTCAAPPSQWWSPARQVLAGELQQIALIEQRGLERPMLGGELRDLRACRSLRPR